MPSISPKSKVLVTGANGYISLWISRYLLDRGFSVRGTIRSPSKGEQVKAVLNHPDFEYIVVEDITKYLVGDTENIQDGAFDEAVKGVEGIAHVASPNYFTEGEPDEVIIPAVRGTVGILESAKAHGTTVKRVVVTSSTSALVHPTTQAPRTFTEADWNDESVRVVREKGVAASGGDKYAASKALAERAIWAFVETNKTSMDFDVVTILPGLNLGPVLQKMTSPTDASISMGLLFNLIKNPHPDPTTYTNHIVHAIDVRDVADAHIEALLHPEAANRRFIVASHSLRPQKVYDIIHANQALKDKGVNPPVGVPGAADNLEPLAKLDDSAAKTILGIKERPFEDTIVEAVTAFTEAGLLP
ncbi:methylglyoxal reductase (NADPH-dependent) gre2 [Tulasnella sp. 425]|nr:methylglyoxal reductase (NADPH-dependent) gre2 [Tulasnella sp. 425]